MKMIYQTRQTNKNKLFGSTFSKIFFLIIFFILAIFISYQSFFTKTLFPFLKSGNYFYDSFFTISGVFSDKFKTIEENKILSERLEEMRISMIDYESIKNENKNLYAELGLRTEAETLGAKIVSRPPQTSIDSIIIDRGDSDGVEMGDLVLVGDRVLIGKVVRVLGETSVVALSSLADTVSYGFIERTGELIEIVGVGGSNMHSKLPIDFDIKVDDKVMLEGSTNHVVGIVGSIEENRSVGFSDIYLSMPANISKIRAVFVESLVK